MAAAEHSRGSPPRDETEAERLDRNFSELLQELRVVQTGGQLLFAFLMSLAFTQTFQQQGDRLHQVYVVTLLLTVLASALLVAPAAYHRHYFRRGLKEEVVLVSHRLAQAGLVTLAFAISGAVLLVLMVVLEPPWPPVVAGCVLVVVLLLWFRIPALRRDEPDDERGERSP